MFAIVNELTTQAIPCLTIHDSFILKKQDLPTPKALMTTTDFPDKSLVSGLVGKVPSGPIGVDKI